jgi:hypothetical protein
MSKRTTNLTPPRKPRGSLRKAKRAEMRKQKMVNLAAARAKAQNRAQATAQATAPKGRVLRQAVRNSIRLVSRKASTAEEPHELSVELSGGKTISQGIMGIV